MNETEKRAHSQRPDHVNRKRRFREAEDNDSERHFQRRRYHVPPHMKLRKQLLGLAGMSHGRIEDDVEEIANVLIESFDDDDSLRSCFLDLTVQIVLEQPLKIPFLAAVCIIANGRKPEMTRQALDRICTSVRDSLAEGAWRSVKLSLRYLACIQCLLQADGVFPLLDELFLRAVDLQTASSEDALGLELVKIILLTIAYLMASPARGNETRARGLLEKTDIIASAYHVQEALVNPYPEYQDSEIQPLTSVIKLLQRQLQAESTSGWKLRCIPRPWERYLTSKEDYKDHIHAVPDIPFPKSLGLEVQPRLPEIYLTVYPSRDTRTVPPSDDISSSIIRDSLVDTINVLDFNRHATAQLLIDVDLYFTPGTFVKRATPFDKLRELDKESSMWKPEDVGVDAVFSQLFRIPAPEHKLVYYHSVLTEACKIAPAAIAPSLGRAIRFLYRNLESMDLDLQFRFLDWFSHHLSNFGFTWKWSEWVDDVTLPPEHPSLAFIAGSLEKETRLSVVQRIRGTLPEPYHSLLPNLSKEDDPPPFPYESNGSPFAQESREILRVLKQRGPDSQIQEQIDSIKSKASEIGNTKLEDPAIQAYVTCICFAGAKSLSHVLSYIERCKDRLLAIASTDDFAKRQIAQSVMEYWIERPGVGINIIDKLLNYAILTPKSVLQWVIKDRFDRGRILARAYIYEMVANIFTKVTTRIRQMIIARNQSSSSPDERAILDETVSRERGDMEHLFSFLEEELKASLNQLSFPGAETQSLDSQDSIIRRKWCQRWLRVFQRKMIIEQDMIDSMLKVQPRAEGYDGSE